MGAVTYLRWSQLTFLGSLVLCAVLLPSVPLSGGGVSNFGNHLVTVVPYVVGFVVNIALLGAAGWQLRRQAVPGLSLVGDGLWLLGLLELGVLLSTFSRHSSLWLTDVHDGIGIALFACELLGAVWLATRRRHLLAFAALGLQAAGSLVGLLSLEGVVHVLFVGQVAGAFGAGVLLAVVLPEAIAAWPTRDLVPAPLERRRAG